MLALGPPEPALSELNIYSSKQSAVSQPGSIHHKACCYPVLEETLGNNSLCEKKIWNFYLDKIVLYVR